LLPPTLGELISEDHPARFVAAFVDSLDRAAWVELGIGPDGDSLGAPAYHPRALLSVWIHGFMTGIRSCRKLEAACRDQVPYLWLTAWQHPDHNTLWRFYQAHRQVMWQLLKYTVATAIEMNLIDMAVQAVGVPYGLALPRYYAQAPAVDANRRSPQSVHRTPGVERTHLRHSQRPDKCQEIPAAWSGQCQGGMQLTDNGL